MVKFKLYQVDVTPVKDKYGDICLYAIDNGEYLTLIEAGPSNGLVRFEDWLEDNGYGYRDIKYIMLTHIHLDHGGGVGYIIENNPDVKVFVHPRGAKHLADTSKLWKASLDTIGYVAKIYGKPKNIPQENIYIPGDGERIDIGVDTILFIYTPGHASHHMSIYLINEGILFTGDSAGLYHNHTLLPTTPKPHNVEKSLESIKKMLDLHPRKLGFTHFGIGDDATVLLNRYKIIYEKWVSHVRKGYIDGLNVKEIYEELRRIDINIQIQERFFNYRGYGEEEVLLSLYGIYSYFEWIDKNKG